MGVWGRRLLGGRERVGGFDLVAADALLLYLGDGARCSIVNVFQEISSSVGAWHSVHLRLLSLGPWHRRRHAHAQHNDTATPNHTVRHTTVHKI